MDKFTFDYQKAILAMQLDNRKQMFVMQTKLSVSTGEQISWIRLTRSKNVGPGTFYQLIRLFGSAACALDNIDELAAKGGSKRKITLTSEDDVLTEIDLTERYGARLICSCDAAYPQLLMRTPDAPPVITVLGRNDIFNNHPSVAIVGARNASLNGSSFAKHLAADLAERNITIVSGLARGIDTAAHIGALNNITIAVIAGGIDHIYPPENEKLYWQIAGNGAVIAELPIGCPPLARHFPQRNRIIAGIAHALAVIEAAKKSGSLITAEVARAYARKVFAVPGSPLDERAGGTNYLLKNGATLLESSQDIISYMNSLGNSMFETNASYTPPANTGLPPESELAQYRKQLQQALSYTPVSMDLILAETAIPFTILNVLVLELELAGRLTRSYGNKICLVNMKDINKI